MDAILNSMFLIFASEMGDKTQLLALILTARYKKPWTILLGIFIATLLNHALAAASGVWLSENVSQEALRTILAIVFFAFAIWLLVPDKADDLNPKEDTKLGPLLTTIIVFFLAEMGDKTQIATVALGAQYSSTLLVTVGSTVGMIASNSLAVFLGDSFLAKVPMKYVRYFACALFAAFGVWILFFSHTLMSITPN